MRCAGWTDPDTGEWRDSINNYMTASEVAEWEKEERNRKIKFYIVLFSILFIVFCSMKACSDKIYTDRHLAADGGMVVDKYTGRYDIRNIVIYSDGRYYTFETNNNEYYRYDIGDIYHYYD